MHCLGMHKGSQGCFMLTPLFELIFTVILDNSVHPLMNKLIFLNNIKFE